MYYHTKPRFKSWQWQPLEVTKTANRTSWDNYLLVILEALRTPYTNVKRIPIRRKHTIVYFYMREIL